MKAIIISGALVSARWDKESDGSSNTGFTVAAEWWGLLSWVLPMENTCSGVRGLREWRFGASQSAPSRDDSGRAGERGRKSSGW